MIMEIYYLAAASVIVLAIVVAFCAIMFKLMNILHDIACVFPIVKNESEVHEEQ